jgi:hypothetical protein
MFLRDLNKWLNMMAVKKANSKILTPTLVTKSKKPELNNLRRLTIILYWLIKIGKKLNILCEKTLDPFYTENI